MGSEMCIRDREEETGVAAMMPGSVLMLSLLFSMSTSSVSSLSSFGVNWRFRPDLLPKSAVLLLLLLLLSPPRGWLDGGLELEEDEDSLSFSFPGPAWLILLLFFLLLLLVLAVSLSSLSSDSFLLLLDPPPRLLWRLRTGEEVLATEVLPLPKVLLLLLLDEEEVFEASDLVDIEEAALLDDEGPAADDEDEALEECLLLLADDFLVPNFPPSFSLLLPESLSFLSLSSLIFPEEEPDLLLLVVDVVVEEDVSEDESLRAALGSSLVLAPAEIAVVLVLLVFCLARSLLHDKFSAILERLIHSS